MRLKVNAYTNIRSAAAPGSSAAKAMEPEHAEKAAAESGAQAPGQSDAAAMMAYLRGKYGNIHFSVLSSANSGNIGSYGSGQTGFNHVAISETLLEKMGADEGLRRYVENILDHMGEYRNTARAGAMIRDRKLVGMGLVIDDDAQAYMWTAVQKRDKDSVYPTYWRDRESTSFYAKNKKARRNSHYNYSHSNNMMRLASARDIPAVKGLLAGKYGELQKVQWQVDDPAEAAAVIRKIKAFIRSGNLKISRLHKEEDLERLRKSAEKKMKERLERQLREELRRKKAARRGQEQCETADIADVFPKSGMNDERFRQIAEQYVQSMFPSASDGGTVSTDTGGASVSTEVTVMCAPVASLDCIG